VFLIPCLDYYLWNKRRIELFKRKDIDPFPSGYPLVEERRVQFFLLGNVKMTVLNKIPIQLLEWNIRNHDSYTFLPYDGGGAIVLICSQVVSILTDSEIPTKEDDNVAG